MGNSIANMGNDMADAIRDELREALIRQYGTLEAAAEATGVAYKTLYRALTRTGKDRSQSVKLDLVMEIAEHLTVNFADLYQRAKVQVDSTAATYVPAHLDDLERSEPAKIYGLAADEPEEPIAADQDDPQ